VAVACALWFTFGLNVGAYGLAWAQVIWAGLEITALFVVMNFRMPKLFDKKFGMTILKMVVATGIMSVETYTMVSIVGLRFDDQNILMVLPQLALIGISSAVVYLIVSYLFKLEEAMPVISKISKFFLPKPKVVPPQE
jgi:hypothetical protein